MGVKEAMQRSGIGAFLDSIPDGACILDGNRRVVYWNAILTEWTGISPESARGRDISEFIHYDQQRVLSLILTQVMEGGGAVYLSPQLHPHFIPAPYPNGGLRIQQTIIQPQRGPLPGESTLLLIIHDVTEIVRQVKAYRAVRDRALQELEERTRAENALQVSNRKLNLLSSITRHDILNSLTALLMCASMMKEEAKDEGSREGFEKIESIGWTIKRQIDFTKNYQDVGVKSPQWQNVQSIVNQAREQLEGAGFRLECRVKDLEVYADPLLSKVFYNLMENSMRHGERVTEIRVSYRHDPRGITLVYADNGIGIPDSEKEKIFRRESYKNTGFGLFLSREILSITGLEIRETGVAGEGARFEIHGPGEAFRIVQE
ncbi:MAG: sensory histidine kinase AtoS [Methanoregulaceae archaeon PtaU1.Bin059]|nr:MAG: sensory histidine kinase AtoS [Methanoregulaceae archaeon PtaB.Bin056]OPY39655.1 MAG: sensory histidine kinase AtoS [Methanoregulaceae archaeon PtaU1.Bin059]